MTGKHNNSKASTRVKTSWRITLWATACMIILASCGQPGTDLSAGANQGVEGLTATQVAHGPAIDRIIFQLRTDPSQALADVAAGKADLILNSLPPVAFRNLDPAELAKLELYTVPAESWSLLINPIPNAAPYTWTTASGQTYFNPLAIREVRYALNWLFDRQHLVNEILGGHGEAGFSPIPPSLASTTRYEAVPVGLGMSATGDANRAIEEITSAMNAAARLPENKGRLLRAADGFWYFDGQPASIKFLIRADEPAGRLPVGRYLAAQIEKTGIRVQRIERDRSALALAYFSNPADLAFHIYTEAWASRADNSDWTHTPGKHYAPHHRSLPGGADPAWWQYRSPELDKLAITLAGGQFPDEEARLADSLQTLELGLKEAVRIYLAFQHDTFVTSKARFESPLAPDPVAGFIGRSLRTVRLLSGSRLDVNADSSTPGNVSGNSDASGDTAGTGNTTRLLRILQVQAEGATGIVSWDPANPDGFADAFSGTIADLVSDPGFVSDAASVAGTGLTAVARSASDVGTSSRAEAPGVPGRWHNGIKLGPDDLHYAGLNGIGQTPGKTVSRETNREPGRDASEGAPWNTRLSLPWDLYEVLGQLAADGAAGGQRQSLDLASPDQVNAIKAGYQKLLESQRVPSGLEDHTSPEVAAERYRASIAFIEKYGHALISNGPFVLASLDAFSGTAELEAFRDYPYGSDYPVRSAQD